MRLKSRMKWLAALVVIFTLFMTSTVLASSREPFETPEEPRWAEEGGAVARWNRVENAKKYQVALYCNGIRVKKLEVRGLSVDLSEYIESDDEYYFGVKAIPTDGQQNFSDGEWAYSDELDTDWLGVTIGRWRTYRAGNKFQKEDGTYYSGEWVLIRGCWYYFNADSYVATGWNLVDGVWYYMDSDGVMQTGWIELDGTWYYLDASGAMQTGWVQYKPGQWYYLDANGKMLTNTVVEGHQLDATGLRIN